MNVDARDLRTAARYIVREPFIGSFGSASVNVLNIADHGLQIEHAQPIRLGTTGRVWFRCGNVSVSVQALIIWSRLSQTQDSTGKYPYRSGVRVQSGEAELAEVLRHLVAEGRIELDEHSLDRKKQTLAAKAHQKEARPVVKIIHVVAIDPDQILLIEHARKRLRENPEDAKRWHNRARFALNDDNARMLESTHHRDDILAVWEYLERSVDLSTIIRVFER